MKIKNIGFLLVSAAFLFMTACEGDFRQKAIGENDSIIVVMDSTQFNSETADALMETFSRTIETIPGRGEALFRLEFRDFRTNDELDQIKKFKNIIFATPINAETNTGSFVRALLAEDVEQRVREGQSFAFPIRNQWYRDQWALILTSSSDAELAENIRNAERELVQNALNVEFDRWEENVFRRHEQTEISDSLWDRYGWKVRMQHDYIQTVDTLNVVTFRRYLPDNDRWMWAWWEDGVEDPEFIDQNWINATRDSLMELYVRGERENSYITTEYRRPVNTNKFETDDRLEAWETLGTWRMTADFMGGPFVNFTYYDPDTERLFMVEYGQFAPRVAKRRFVHQFRAMGRTFESDSTFSPNDYPDDYITLAED